MRNYINSMSRIYARTMKRDINRCMYKTERKGLDSTTQKHIYIIFFNIFIGV